jgi:signal transduction histidine kinase
MANAVRFPIRAKLLLLISGLILAATGSYLALAVKLFKDDKTALVYELNTSSVKTLAAETEASVLKIADKMKLLTQGQRDEAWAHGVFEAEPDLISFTLFAPPENPESNAAADWKPVASVRNSDYLKLYGLQTSEVDKIREQVPVPFAKVLSKRTWAMNATLPGGAPVLTLAMAIDVREGEKQTERVAVADVRLDKILKLLSGRGIATAYLVDAEGGVIAHPDMALVSKRASLGDVPIVRDAVDSQVAAQTKSFDWNGEAWLGAYASVGFGGLRVVSQVREAEAFNASKRLLQKSLLFALIVITVGLLISRRFAQGLTLPLEQLLEATEKLASGQYGASTIHVKTQDEVARLARAFNAMASNIQAQRSQLENSRQELEIKVKERTEALEFEKKRQAEAQDALLRTTRLASLGELAGSAAHEVLNPVNNMNIRVERLRAQLTELEAPDVKLLGEILAAWHESYDKGGWAALQAELIKPVQAGDKKTLIEEDFENLTAISDDLSKRLSERKENLDFFAKEITRITRIINNMRALSRVGGDRRPVDVHLPIEDTAMTLGDLFAKRGVSLVKDFSADSREMFTVIAEHPPQRAPRRRFGQAPRSDRAHRYATGRRAGRDPHLRQRDGHQARAPRADFRAGFYDQIG